MQGMYELVSSFVLFTTHISYSLVLNYSCEAIKSIYVYAVFFFPFTHTHTHTHIYQKETLFSPPRQLVFKIDTDIVFYPLLICQPVTCRSPNLILRAFLNVLNKQISIGVIQ